MENLQKEVEELRKNKGESPGSKGVVPPSDKFGKGLKQMDDIETRDWFSKKLKEITSDHDLYMEDVRNGRNPSLARGNFFDGFGELAQLQADSKSHTLPLPGESDDNYSKRMRAMERNTKDDLVVSRITQV